LYGGDSFLMFGDLPPFRFKKYFFAMICFRCVYERRILKVMVEIGGSGHLIPTVDFVQISTQPVLTRRFNA